MKLTATETIIMKIATMEFPVVEVAALVAFLEAAAPIVKIPPAKISAMKFTSSVVAAEPRAGSDKCTT
jgi:hypothetical protein